MFSNTDRRRIEIAAEPLRHIGDARRRCGRDVRGARCRRRVCGCVRPAGAARRRRARAASTCRRRPVRRRRWPSQRESTASRCRAPGSCRSDADTGLDGESRRGQSETSGSRGVRCAGQTASCCDLHIGVAGQAGLDVIAVGLEQLAGRCASLTRYISFSRSFAVSTALGVNCASAATNDTVAGMHVVRHRVEHDACVASRAPPGRPRWSAGRWSCRRR